MKTFFKILFLSFLTLGLTYKTHSQTDPEKTREMIMKVYDIFNSYQYDKLGDYINDNFNEHSPDPGQKPGLSGLKENFEHIKTAYPDYKFTVNDVIINSSGEKASVLFTFNGTNTGEMMGMKPTGKSVNIQGLDYLYFKEGKLTDHWGYIDMNKMMEQLGMMPPPKDKN